MRVNIEESVFEHIPRLAKEMGWDYSRALGQLVRVYRATQLAEIHEETPSRLVTICALVFDSDGEAERFFWAMVAAHLAVLLDNKLIRIRGNGEHIERLQKYRDRAKAGGIARANHKSESTKEDSRENSENLNDSLASKLLAGSHKAATLASNSEPSLAPMLLSSYTENNTNTDLPSTKPRCKRKASSGASPSEGRGRTIPFREAWKEAYRKKLGAEAAWGQRESGQVAQLLGSYTSDELVALVPYFFGWKRPDVIRGGYSFGRGNACFVLKIDELRADISDSKRRKEAAQIDDNEKQANKQAAILSQAERVIAKLEGNYHETEEPAALVRTEERLRERALLGASREDGPGEENFFDGPSVQSESER